MTKTIKTIGQIAELQGVSQATIAKRTGFTLTSINRWFNGQREPNIKNVEKLADALDLKLVVAIK